MNHKTIEVASELTIVPATVSDIAEGAVLIGPQFNEPMRVLGSPSVGGAFVIVNLVGTRTNSYKGGVTLTKADLRGLQIERGAAHFARPGIRSLLRPFDLAR